MACTDFVVVESLSHVIARFKRAIVRSRARSVQGGASPLQVNLLRPVANRNCVAVRRGGEQRKANGAVRSESKLDSATLTGEPAIERRSLYLCEQEAQRR